MFCSVYEDFRSTLKEYLSSFSDILSLSDEQLFPILMSCKDGDYEFTKAVCKFVNASFEKRSHHLKVCQPECIIPGPLSVWRWRSVRAGERVGTHVPSHSSARTLLGQCRVWAQVWLTCYRYIVCSLLFAPESSHGGAAVLLPVFAISWCSRTGFQGCRASMTRPTHLVFTHQS